MNVSRGLTRNGTESVNKDYVYRAVNLSVVFHTLLQTTPGSPRGYCGPDVARADDQPVSAANPGYEGRFQRTELQNADRGTANAAGAKGV